MKEISKQRTIAFISPGGAGKTTLAESILYLTKVTNRLGKVGDGTSILDFEPEEIKRGISINAAFHAFPWKKHDIHFVDTPGDENFLNDTKTCLQGVDGVVVLVDAVDGVKVGTEKVWGFADSYKLPRLVLVNKMDRERADFFNCLEELGRTFKIACLPVQVPLGAEMNFKGLVDLLDRKAYLYDDQGKFTAVEIPEEMKDAVEKWREKLVESIAEADDELLEKYLEAGELSSEELVQGLVAAVRNRTLAPVLCAAGSKLIGLPHLLDKINECLPSPAERGTILGKSAAGDDEIPREPSPEAPFCGLVIKTITDPFAGQLSIFRVFSGTLKPDSTVYNPNTETKERFGQLLALEGKQQKTLEEAGPGVL
ncbi:MAG: GTP-binding protein, partial [Pseudomonadota bacterium]